MVVVVDLQLGWFGLGAALGLLALFILLRAREMWAKSGLPVGTVIYSDSGTWFPQQEPLYDHEHRLVGRPDYLVEEPGGALIPVEVKSAVAPRQPHTGHVLQLAAYCLLVGTNYGMRPDYGILQYRDRAFEIAFTPELEMELLDLLEEMQIDRLSDDLERDHEDAKRCARCSYQSRCVDSLV